MAKLTPIEGEIWEAIFINNEKTPFYISNKGRVKSTCRKQDVLRVLHDNTHGYLCVTLKFKRERYTRKVHRLVGLYFISNPNNLPEVCHIDHNKYNNDVSNLKWGTKSDNSRDSAAAGKLSRGKRKLPPIQIGKFFAGICIKKYPSLGSVVKDGYPRVSVSRNLDIEKTYKGFNWKKL